MPSRRYERNHAATFPDTRPGGGFDNAVKEALRRPLNKVFGTPEEPTRLGRFMNGLEEGAALSMMAYGGAAGRVGNLRRFTQLSRRPGVQPSTLKKWTNIERGVYGLGVETKGDAYLRPASVYGGINNRPLAQMAWVHPDVLKVHPKMGEVPVAIVPDAAWVSTVERARRGMTSWSRDGSTADGFSMSDGRGIAIRGKRPGEDIIAFNERADRTLVHEMQHVSQDFDGIRPARGHASYSEYRTDGREVDARNTANRNHLTPQERTEMPRNMTQDVKADLVQLDDKGGDNFGTFRNFLATDEVPDSLFGYPIAHDENGYTEKDIQFFKENPKAAGFYDLGDEEMEEDVPQQATGAGVSMLASIFGPVGLNNLRKANWKHLPELAKYEGHGHEIQIGELKDVRLRKGWEQALLWKEKKLSDILDFSSPQGRRLIAAYPGIQNIPVTNEDRGTEAGAYGGYSPPSAGEQIWLNPHSIGAKGDLPLESQYDKILHEGINHAIFSREPSFQGPNVATWDLPSSKLTPLGYAINLNEVLASLASRRGAERFKTKQGEANSSEFVAEILPEVERRVNALAEAALIESQGKILAEDVVPVRAAVPEDDMDLPKEEPVPAPVRQDSKGGNTRQDSKGGDAGSETPVSETPIPSDNPAPAPTGPRIVINPAVFHDKRDALCVTFNEAFRLVMSENGFEPVSEPTEKQRKFFADTAYANDELQLRRTILARIATLDASVSDPTDEQLEETMEMLEMVMEVGAPQNEWEQQAVQRLHDVIAKTREASESRLPASA